MCRVRNKYNIDWFFVPKIEEIDSNERIKRMLTYSFVECFSFET